MLILPCYLPQPACLYLFPHAVIPSNEKFPMSNKGGPIFNTAFLFLFRLCVLSTVSSDHILIVSQLYLCCENMQNGNRLSLWNLSAMCWKVKVKVKLSFCMP